MKKRSEEKEMMVFIERQEEKKHMRLSIFKVILIGLLTMATVTGCGSVYAGTTVNIETELTEGILNGKNPVKYYDGTDMVSQEVTVSGIFVRDAAKSIMKKYDYTKIPMPSIPGYWAVINITPSNEGTLPVTITDNEGNALISNGITADTVSYYLGDGWYAAPVPEQIQTFSFTAGDKILSYVPPKPQPAETTAETQTEAN